jgi:rod shape-determining protein MreD
MIWKRAVLLVLLAVTGLLLETAVLGTATLDGSKPELLLLFVIAVAMNEGPEFGAVAGFVLGLLTDLFLGLPRGMSALVFTGIGFGVGRARLQMSVPGAWIPITVAFAATAVGVLAYGGIGMLLALHIAARSLVRHALLASAYNALLMPFVFPLVRVLGGKLRPAGVHR